MEKLKDGNKIAILSPASIINPAYVTGAVETLRHWGVDSDIKAHALGRHGSFSGTPVERLADLRDALYDPEVKVILCSRGGYGCVHLLPELDMILTELTREGRSPKLLVGFSDISALHALWGKYGWPSIHASMTKHLALAGPEDELNLALLSLLKGTEEQPCLTFPTGFSGSEYGRRSRTGETEGIVTGGNMAVLGGLIGTEFNPIRPGAILLMEDIAEPIYKVERILCQLRLAGIFDQLAGIVVGQFTDYAAPSADHADMYAMIDRFLDGMDIPVAMDVPIGHIERNHPLILNRRVHLTVTPSSAILRYL